MNSKFIIQKSKNGQWFFNLVAANGEVIATSEMYTSKQACYNGVDAVISAAGTAEIVEKSNY
jgi:uncharacterized protein YegP (UPF0339 family)